MSPGKFAVWLITPTCLGVGGALAAPFPMTFAGVSCHIGVLEEVCAEWLDPDALAQWMCPHPAHPTRIELDPTVGGRYRFDISDGPATLVVTGRYVQLEPGRLLCFTWSCDTWADPDTESMVTVSLTPSGSDCVMSLVHDRLPVEQVPMLPAGRRSPNNSPHALCVAEPHAQPVRLSPERGGARRLPVVSGPGSGDGSVG